MKKLHDAGWVIFVLGIIFKLFHYPGTSTFLLLGALLLFIHALVFLIKNGKSDLPKAFLHLSFSAITIYVLFRLLFWNSGPMIFGCSLMFLIVTLIIFVTFYSYGIRKIKFELPQIVLVIYFIFFLGLSFTHSDRVFYFFTLNTTINGDTRDQNYYAWDKYSWFLFLAGKQEEALEANKNAQKAVEDVIRVAQDAEAVQFSTIIKQHTQKIIDKNWTSYP